MDQESMTGAFCAPLSRCFNLEELDLTGDVNVGDDGIQQLPRGDVLVENKPQIVGLQKLRILKLNGLTKVSDHSLIKLCAASHVIEHIELTKCEGLTDYSIDMVIKQAQTLKFIDLNSIPAITPQVLEQLKLIKPELLIRRFLY